MLTNRIDFKSRSSPQTANTEHTNWFPFCRVRECNPRHKHTHTQTPRRPDERTHGHRFIKSARYVRSHCDFRFDRKWISFAWLYRRSACECIDRKSILNFARNSSAFCIYSNFFFFFFLANRSGLKLRLDVFDPVGLLRP